MVKNLKDVIRKFQDEDACRKFLVHQRWGGVPVCPYCGCTKSYKIEGGKRFKCANKECYKKYSVTVGTVFEASNIPLSTWFPAMYLILAHKKGISSIQLGKDLGVTQKTAWFMLHRIREQLKADGSPLLGEIIEVDETYVGGKVKNMSKKKRAALRTPDGGTEQNKIMVVGLLKRGGDLRFVVGGKANGAGELQPIIRYNVDKSAILMTDGYQGYTGLGNEYAGHQTVNHKADEFVRDGIIHTNGVEGSFSLLKRAIIGIYHQLSPKHLFRYCNEISHKYNTRKIKDGERFENYLKHLEGRLTYKELIKKTDLSAELLISPGIPPLKLGNKRLGRPVLQLQGDEIVGQYPSIAEAVRVTGLKQSSISRVLAGKKRTTGGFGWKFA